MGLIIKFSRILRCFKHGDITNEKSSSNKSYDYRCKIEYIYIYITEICLCVFEGERRLLSTAVKILKFVNKLSTRWGKLT